MDPAAALNPRRFRPGVLVVLLTLIAAPGAAANPSPPLCRADLEVLTPEGFALPLQDDSPCEDHLEAVRKGFQRHQAERNEQWEDLEPLIEAARRCLGNTHNVVSAKLYDYETSLLLRTRRYDEADAAFNRFFRNEAAHAAPDVVARMHQRRGLLYTRMGRHAASLQEYVRAGALVDSLSTFEGAELLVRVGNRFRHLGELARAQRYYATAESLLAARGADDPALAAPFGRVRTYQGASLIAAAERDGEPVDAAARRAQPLIEEAIGLIPEEPGTLYERVQAQIWLGIARRRGGDPAGALVPFAEARHLSASMMNRYPNWTSWALSEEGRALIDLGRFDEARAVLERAYAIDRASGRRDNEATALEDLGLLAEALAAAATDPAQTAVHLQTAAQHYHDAIALTELTRQAYGTLEWSASAFEDLQEPYRRLVRVRLRQGRPADAFLLLDRTRARYLRDLRASTRLRATLDMPRLTRLDSLSDALQDARYARRTPDLPLAEQTALDARIIGLQREIEQITGFTPAPPPPLALPDLQAALHDRNQVLLSYFLDEKTAYAFVVRPDTFAAVPLATDVDALQAELARIGPMWRTEETEPDPAFALAPLKRLYDALFAPVADLIPNGAPLVIIPEEPLTGLPFGMLLAESGRRFAYAELPFLVRRHPISTELAAALLLESPPPSESRLDVVAFGRSRFGGEAASERGRLPLLDLPHVPTELARVAQRLPRSRVALDERATETALFEQMRQARIVHLASHAVVNAAFPLYSYIALWDGPQDEDGRLYLFELDRMALSSELVVLSGCSTARGERRLGEGMIGLQHAFRAAGAASSLATLWQVDDRAMTELTDRFYAHLRRGLRKDEALQQAQLDYLQAHTGLSASPFFWAAPVLSGDPRPVELPAQGPPSWLYLIGLALIAGGVALGRRRLRVTA